MLDHEGLRMDALADTLASKVGLSGNAAIAVADEAMRSVLSDPRVSAAQKKELFAAVGGERFTANVKNLIGVSKKDLINDLETFKTCRPRRCR